MAKNESSRKLVRHRAVHQRRPTPPSLALSLEGEPRFSKGARFSGKTRGDRFGEGRNDKFKFRDGLNGANVSTRSCPPVYGGGEERWGGKSGDDPIEAGRPIFEIQNVARIDRVLS